MIVFVEEYILEEEEEMKTMYHCRTWSFSGV
jgi:hypothetical protein